MFDIWNSYNEMAELVYKKDNYIKRNKTFLGRGYCVIYCSSNDIWYPNEEKAFRRSFIDGDHYEWTKIACDLASKEIFIRDIYKSWYVTGINERINTVDKLIEFVRVEAGDMPIICVGSSSGGYLAALLGAKLHAVHVVAFSAQWELSNQGAMGVNPFLQRYQNDPNRAKYYDLKPILEYSDVPVYYIVPIRNAQDRFHYEHINGVPCVYPLVFNSRHHGVVIPKGNLSSLLSLTTQQLHALYKEYQGRTISPIGFSIKNEGIIKTIRDLWKAGYKKVKSKIGR